MEPDFEEGCKSSAILKSCKHQVLNLGMTWILVATTAQIETIDFFSKCGLLGEPGLNDKCKRKDKGCIYFLRAQAWPLTRWDLSQALHDPQEAMRMISRQPKCDMAKDHNLKKVMEIPQHSSSSTEIHLFFRSKIPVTK